MEMLKATPAVGGGVPVPVPVSGAGEAVERVALGNEGASDVERLEPLF